MNWKDIPDTSLEHILSYLSFSEGRRFYGLSKALWEAKVVIERRAQRLVLQPEEGQRYVLNQPFLFSAILYHMFGGMSHSIMESLCVDECVDDGFLMVGMLQLGLFPNLQSLRMRSCTGVSDVGLEALSRSVCAASLRTIDITFCCQTTYKGTFSLRERDRLPNLEWIRRQPEWLDGQFDTPFVEDSGESEVHVYYADGSFSFSRASQSNGFVLQLYQWGEQFLGDKLQYNNFPVPDGWPSWTRLSYRPGVCLLRLDRTYLTHGAQGPTTTTTTNTNTNAILVGQYTRGLRPPQNQRLMERAKDIVPLGEFRYFDPVTFEMVERDEAGAAGTRGSVMISKMRVRPLTQLMPPPELLQACRTTCAQCAELERWDSNVLAHQEARLERILLESNF
jgi:hypothetical protein